MYIIYNSVLICTVFVCKAPPKRCIGRGYNKVIISYSYYLTKTSQRISLSMQRFVKLSECQYYMLILVRTQTSGSKIVGLSSLRNGFDKRPQ